MILQIESEKSELLLGFYNLMFEEFNNHNEVSPTCKKGTLFVYFSLSP
jgi:hypothetical protein